MHPDRFGTDGKKSARMKILVLDVTADICPMTFVRTRLQLDKLPGGAVLDILYKGEEPRRNLPRSLTEQGHEVLEQVHGEDGQGRLRVRKAG
jgi:TusA-related sulfurtransferase